MAKTETIKKLLAEKKEREKLQKQIQDHDEKMLKLAEGLTEEDLDELVGPINKELRELDEKRRDLQRQKRDIIRQVLPKVPSSRKGAWECNVEKKGKDTVVTVLHSASKKPFVKKITNGDDLNKAYLGMRASMIEHFKGVVTDRATESFMTNTLKARMGIA